MKVPLTLEITIKAFIEHNVYCSIIKGKSKESYGMKFWFFIYQICSLGKSLNLSECQFWFLTITLCTRQQKRHWCIEQSYGLCGRGRGWEDLGEWHWNMYNIMYETSCQSRFDAWYWMLGASPLGRPRGMVWGGRREEGSGWGTHVYLRRIHFDVWQN